MAKRTHLQTYDSGIVIFDEDTKEYWCNLNTWSQDIRKVCIYHSMEWVQEIINKFPNRNLKIAHVDIRLTDIQN